MWRPCTGVDGVVPPLCKWSDLNDGTYSLGDVERMNQVIDEAIRIKKAAMNNAP